MMFRTIITAFALLATPAALAQQQNAPDLVDFMIRPSQDAVIAPEPFLDDPWAPLDAEEPPSLPLARPINSTPVVAPPAQRRSETEPDPFEPTGVHLGTFVIRPSLEIGLVATDNASGEEEKDGAVGLLAAPAVSIRSDWSRHEVQAEARGRVIHYGDQSIDVRDGSARVSGRLDIGSRTALDGEAGYALFLDSYTDPDTPFGATQRPANHRLDTAAGLTHRFNRLSFRVGAEAVRELHDEVEVAGGTDPRSDLDFLRTGLRLRAAYEAGPALTPYVELAGGRKDFDEEVDSSGYRRSGDWGELRGGLIFDLGPKTSGEVSVGYYREEAEDPRLDELSGVVASAALLWSPRRLTTIRFELATDVSPTSIAGASGSFVYSGRVTVERQLRHRLRLEAGLGLEHERFVGAPIEETTWSGFAGMTYALSRSAALQARYEHERTESTLPGSDATVNTVSVRVRLQR